MTLLHGWRPTPEPPRYKQPLFLGDQASRKYWADRKPTVEIEVVRDGQRIKRRGVLHSAGGLTVFVGMYCYLASEILAYRKVAD